MAWMIAFYGFCVLMIGFELFFIIYSQYKDFKEGITNTSMNQFNYPHSSDSKKK